MEKKSSVEASLRRQQATLSEERVLAAQGYSFIAGVDEVGRGPLAGPAVAAAVILPRNIEAGWLSLVRDSKQLTAAARETLFPLIQEASVAVGIGYAEPGDIDSLGIARAVRMAMSSAVANLSQQPDFLLIDFLALGELAIPQRSVAKADCFSASVACASIIAKVTRDRLMTALDELYPHYGFARHKGYGTPEHLDCLRRLGACPAHRRSFAPVREFLR
ncbi:MAG: ribonuclease HII [Chloroflexota bacterium]